MCGIIGELNTAKTTRQKSHDYVINNIKHIVSRGPDKTKIIHDDPHGLSLGMSTLSINNPASNYGPYTSNDERYILVYNGEIYNERFLRSRYGIELNKNENDAHLLLKLLQLYREKCINLLRGMFCFAIYDRKLKELLIANDPYGQKFIYWRCNKEKFVFCSSFLALRENSNIDDEFDSKFYQFENFIDNNTPYENIYKLKPASILRVNIINEEVFVAETSYYEIETNMKVNKTECADISDLIVSSILDCKVEHSALMLSGGLDSALLAAILRPKIAITVSFEEHDAFDEEEKAKLVCERFGIEHIVLRPNRKIFEASFCDIASKLQYPIGNASIFPEYLVYKYLHARGVRVCYSGVGADEFFLGYERMRIFMNRVNSHACQVPENYIPLSDYINKNYDESRSIIENYLAVLARNNQRFDVVELFNNKVHYQELGQLLSIIEATISLPGLLRTTDALSGAFGIEVRSPFLNPDIVQAALSLPDELKLNDLMGTKAPLRMLAHEIGVPIEIVTDPVKRGFAAPYGLWRTGIAKSTSRGIFDRSQLVSDLVDLFRLNKKELRDPMFDLVNLEEIHHA